MANTEVQQEIEPCGRAAMYGAATMKKVNAAIDGDELRAPNGRLAVLSGALWLGMFSDGGRDREPKVYAGFEVTFDADGRICSVRKVREYDKKTEEFKNIRRNYYGRATSATPYQLFQVSIVVEGRNCQLFTL